MSDLPPNLTQAFSMIVGPTAIMADVENAAAILLRLSVADIDSTRRPGTVVKFTPALGEYPTAAVFVFVTVMYDQPDAPMGLDCFLNVADESDRALLDKLTRQRSLEYHFYDESLTYHYSKRIKLNPTTRKDLRRLIARAERHNAGLDVVDFPTARKRYMAENPL